MRKSPINLLVILGPTASGKTSLAVNLASRLDGEIISADSRQVYRGLDIGSGKDLEEYRLAEGAIPYHLIDVVDLEQEYSLYDFTKDFDRTFDLIRRTGRRPILVGGSGLYLDSVLRSYALVHAPLQTGTRQELAKMSEPELEGLLRSLKPDLHNTTDLASRERMIRAIEIERANLERNPVPRPSIRPLVLGIHWEPQVLRQRIATRLNARLGQGMIQEVRALIARGVSHARLQQLGLEYAFISDYLSGRFENHMAFETKLHQAICRFAKRQRTWFRRMERHGIPIRWIDGPDPQAALGILEAESHWAPH